MKNYLELHKYRIMIKLKFKTFNSAPVILILGCCSLLLPYILFYRSLLFQKGHFLMLFWMELLFCFTIFFLWYKIYYEIIFAKIENDVLYYRKLFFIKYSIKLSDVKGFKVGSEESDFYVLYDRNDKKMFVIRMDFYSNYYDFIDSLNTKELGIYYTVYQKIVLKIFK